MLAQGFQMRYKFEFEVLLKKLQPLLFPYHLTKKRFKILEGNDIFNKKKGGVS
jgi:hypothetical protein